MTPRPPKQPMSDTGAIDATIRVLIEAARQETIESVAWIPVGDPVDMRRTMTVTLRLPQM